MQQEEHRESRLNGATQAERTQKAAVRRGVHVASLPSNKYPNNPRARGVDVYFLVVAVFFSLFFTLSLRQKMQYYCSDFVRCATSCRCSSPGAGCSTQETCSVSAGQINIDPGPVLYGRRNTQSDTERQRDVGNTTQVAKNVGALGGRTKQSKYRPTQHIQLLLINSSTTTPYEYCSHHGLSCLRTVRA